jgi:hypothetical protein
MKHLEDAEKIQKRKVLFDVFLFMNQRKTFHFFVIQERFGIVEKEAPPAKKGSFVLKKTLTNTVVDAETAEKLRKRAERFGSTA